MRTLKRGLRYQLIKQLVSSLLLRDPSCFASPRSLGPSSLHNSFGREYSARAHNSQTEGFFHRNREERARLSLVARCIFLADAFASCFHRDSVAVASPRNANEPVIPLFHIPLGTRARRCSRRITKSFHATTKRTANCYDFSFSYCELLRVKYSCRYFVLAETWLDLVT